ncbi:uncharacterized protein L969DRAFT_91986 [Mixia osmundae IAM 14324]|uniref:Uncharacterized protein n=1 Tax=Mixia osmundae (strain CBS 9802 / IAM 14324 / JCM 22182 / KY 12970) TaxID=764103 RepID=G7E2Y4_MIXOS|nr:uncharacterized protein L969DRAFT_91986 [Mixia osmundae IAM 14324]KEI42547.1 hypothetical protein L969DRAFT_91986 [Mixia osmundae IAM 14324]GAA97165.1 hypothetical protein E5Q_03841 [Mixia osmundae IAM 14324]
MLCVRQCQSLGMIELLSVELVALSRVSIGWRTEEEATKVLRASSARRHRQPAEMGQEDEAIVINQGYRPGGLDYDYTTYLSVETELQPSQIINKIHRGDNADPIFLALKHIGPVGELRDENIFGVPVPSAQGLQPEVEPLIEAIRSIEGVKHVDVLSLKQRSKR